MQKIWRFKTMQKDLKLVVNFAIQVLGVKPEHATVLATENLLKKNREACS